MKNIHCDDCDESCWYDPVSTYKLNLHTRHNPVFVPNDHGTLTRTAPAYTIHVCGDSQSAPVTIELDNGAEALTAVRAFAKTLGYTLPQLSLEETLAQLLLEIEITTRRTRKQLEETQKRLRTANKRELKARQGLPAAIGFRVDPDITEIETPEAE